MKRTALTLVSLIVLALVIVYTWSTIILNKKYSQPLTEIEVPHDAASITEGARLAKIAHCGDCHGDNLTGAVFSDIPKSIATLVAPNLTRIVPSYSNAEVVRLLRYGIKKNGHSVYVMPSFMYHELKEESLGKIIAYLRTLKPEADTRGLPSKSTYALLGRVLLIQGKVNPIADMIKPNTEGEYVNYDTSSVSFGRYLAASTCTACHGKDLKGAEGFTPNLIIAASYKKEDFVKLIRTGVAAGDRKIGLMGIVTKKYLSHLNDHEIECIHAYLLTKPTESIIKK